MDKNAIKKFAVWARRELIERVAQRAARFGIEENKPVDEKARVIDGHVLSDEEFEQRRMLIVHIRRDGYKQVMEEVAYTWFNRFIALRFMEVNGYLPSYVRVFSDDSGAFDPQILTEALHVELYGLDMEKVYELEENDKKEELFKYLLITQCNDMSRMLPGLFETIADYSELLFPDNLLREGSVVERMVVQGKQDSIPEKDWKDAVQIIGWLYQYYNSEPKDQVFADLKKNIKISKEKIPAATQLFTPDWIVRYMVENSLGRLWVEGHPDDAMKAVWKYYLEEAPQAQKVETQLAAIRAEYARLNPAQILCCDPCMGSGHILVYMFDVLMQIYLSYGYTTNEAVESIVRNNLWGMDIDDRAAQLAYFAVMMKAQQYDNRWLTKQLRRSAQPNVFALQDSPEISEQLLSFLGDQRDVARRVLDAFRDAKEYGSIIQPNVALEELNALSEKLDAALRDSETQRADVQADAKALFDALWPQIRQCLALVQKYDVVVTNPPYMGSTGMSDQLTNYLKDNYPDTRSDMCTVFMQCSFHICKANGFMSMINTPAWMTMSSFEKLRYDIIYNRTIINMSHFGRGIFGADFGTTAFVIRKSHTIDYSALFLRLFERFGLVDSLDEKKEWFLKQKGKHYSKSSDYTVIPGNPIAYWISQPMLNMFSLSEHVSDYGRALQGTITGDNNRFLRYWFEVALGNTAFLGESGRKWYAHNKGGNYRKWYGNREYVINWENEGYEIKNYKDANGKLRSRPQNIESFFIQGISWSDLTAGKFSARFFPNGSTFDATGPTIPLRDTCNLLYILGYFNTKVFQMLLDITCPGIHYNNGIITGLPIFIDPNKRSEIETYVAACIDMAQLDWDSYETSWDFQRHPLVDEISHGSSFFERGRIDLAECWLLWKGECDERFQHLKTNEEELNRIFIDIYGLQNELTPEVEDKDVTVRRADLSRDIRSLISYAVGCMFGRYSLDKPGLIFAGEPYSLQAYVDKLNDQSGMISAEAMDRAYRTTGITVSEMFEPDRDGILPITDDEYFDDDIVTRFVEWVRTVYGTDTLEENLKFIADALGGKGTPRDVIRQYFLNDFYKDHLKVYQKRPIYWLLDSGKKNGFKCLIYMHRYQPDTLARIRTDYLHELQGRYRNAIETLERQIAGAATSERVKLQKRLTALKAQAEEARVYEEKIHHLADQMIKIDLDDGVKHNYTIFKDVLAPIK